MDKPVLPVSSSSSFTTIATSSSRWNYKAVTVILGLTALGILFYKLFTHYILTSSTFAEQAPPPPLLVTELPPLTGSLHPFTSGLTYQGNPCLNEQEPPIFKSYASGIIRFNVVNIKTLTTYFNPSDFTITCREGTNPVFFNSLSMTNNFDLDFFIPNLPFGKEITVNFGTVHQQQQITLKIEQVVGLYTITQNDDRLDYTSVALADSEVLAPFLEKDLLSPIQPLAIELPNKENTGVVREKTGGVRPAGLRLTNWGERSVIYLLLVSKHSDVDEATCAMALPVVINTKETVRLSLQLLEDFWAFQYKHTTGKSKPTDYLHLQLGGYRQILYPEAKPDQLV